jgi:hypothetical protein
VESVGALCLWYHRSAVEGFVSPLAFRRIRGVGGSGCTWLIECGIRLMQIAIEMSEYFEGKHNGYILRLCRAVLEG